MKFTHIRTPAVQARIAYALTHSARFTRAREPPAMVMAEPHTAPRRAHAIPGCCGAADWPGPRYIYGGASVGMCVRALRLSMMRELPHSWRARTGTDTATECVCSICGCRIWPERNKRDGDRDDGGDDGDNDDHEYYIHIDACACVRAQFA